MNRYFLLTIFLVNIPTITLTNGLAGDFSQRFGASSRLLQAPLIYQDLNGKRMACNKKSPCKNTQKKTCMSKAT